MNAAPLQVSHEGRVFDLLDGPSVGELLRNLLPDLRRSGEYPQEVRVDRCWPIGKADAMGFIFDWSFRINTGRRYSIYGQLGRRRKHTPAASPSENGAPRPSLTRDGIRGLAFEVGETGLSLRSPDCDPMLPQMATCLDRKRMAKRLTAFGMRTDRLSRSGGNPLRIQLGGYRPGRRAALRFGCGDGVGAVHLCGKTFRDDRGKELLQLHLTISEQLRRLCGGRVRVPSPVGFDDELRLAMFYWMPGIPAATIVSTPEVVMDAAVEAICAVHDLPAKGRSEFGPDEECAIVKRWQNVLRHVAPTVADEATGLVDAISLFTFGVQTRHPVTVHRDFYEKQLIVSPECVTVLDLDTIARGDAGVDLGNFLAHQLLRGLARGEREGGFSRQARAFLEKYEARRGGVDRRNLAFYTATALFRLGSVHALRTATSRYRPALWKVAAHFLDRGAFEPHDLPDTLERTETALREVGS